MPDRPLDPGGRGEPPDPRPPGPTDPSLSLSLLCDPCGGTGKSVREGATLPGVVRRCLVCRGTGLAALVWRVSPWDRQAHAFLRAPVGTASVAPTPCEHSAPTDRLSDDVDDAPRCPLCVVIVQVLTAAGQPGAAHDATPWRFDPDLGGA